MFVKRAVPVDEKLARGLTMVEMRSVLKGGREAGATSVRNESHPVRVAFKPVAFRYATGRRPDAGFVDRMVDRFDAFYGEASATVFRQAETLPFAGGMAGKTRRYLMLTPSTSDPGCRSLLASCVCLDVRSTCLMLTQAPLFEFDLHALERFHLRTRSGLVREAMAAFGAALLRDVGLYRIMAKFSDGLSSKAFAMPFADGLLLGHACAPHPNAFPPFATVQFFDDASAIRYDTFATGDHHACRVATFLGPLEMRPEQVALRQGLLDIAQRHSAHLLDQSDSITYLPGLMDRASAYDGDYFDKFERQSREIGRDLKILLKSPGMEAALGQPNIREHLVGTGKHARVRYTSKPEPRAKGPAL